jgi:hypothetical protein
MNPLPAPCATAAEPAALHRHFGRDVATDGAELWNSSTTARSLSPSAGRGVTWRGSARGGSAQARLAGSAADDQHRSSGCTVEVHVHPAGVLQSQSIPGSVQFIASA